MLLFLSVLEYGDVIWGPQYILDQQQMEIVQRKTTMLNHDLWDCAYYMMTNLLN